jgi:hypothetical protein
MNWDTEIKSKHTTVGHWCREFSIYESKTTGRCVLSSGAPTYIGPIHTETLDEAKVEAKRRAAAKER